jgi:hypothetical protein
MKCPTVLSDPVNRVDAVIMIQDGQPRNHRGIPGRSKRFHPFPKLSDLPLFWCYSLPTFIKTNKIL